MILMFVVVFFLQTTVLIVYLHITIWNTSQ